MQPQMVTALLQAYQTDAMPLSVVFENFQRGELVNPEMEFEEYEAQLADEGPSFADGVSEVQSNAAEEQQGFLTNVRQRLGL
jgi:hypothetical protein